MNTFSRNVRYTSNRIVTSVFKEDWFQYTSRITNSEDVQVLIQTDTVSAYNLYTFYLL